MNKNLEIEIPEEIACMLNHQSQTYTSELTITNHQNVHLYYYIVSTFGNYCKQTTNINSLEAGASATLKFSIKSTNIISKHNQKIVFYISSHKKSMITPSTYAKKIIVKLRFQQQFIEDAEIESIVQEEVEKLIYQGCNLIKSVETIKQAKHMFQEGFQLLRRSFKAIEGMAQCCFISKQWEECLLHIATALLYSPENVNYQFLRAKVLLNFCGDKIGWEGEIMEESFCILKQIENTKKYELSQQQRVQLKYLLGKIQSSPHLNRIKVLKQRILEKAIDKYSPQLAIAKIYTSKAEFDKEMRQFLMVEPTEQKMTPDEIIDPISYEIMQNPYILPSGNSFQATQILTYFNKNGYKDPFTRQDIQVKQAIPNNNLKSYIFEHPKLMKWKQYQKQLLTQ